MNGYNGVGRRELLRGALAAGGVAGLAASGMPAQAALGPMLKRPPLVPIRCGVEEIVAIQSCLRPFRAGGPNLNAEIVGDKLVVHNYGHGGSGWSLSWGSAEVAVGKALSVTPKEIAVIGCGVIGLTAAVHAQRAGLKVTIYAREPYERTRSVRAGGTWSPDSRVSLTEPAGPQFAALWEHMARFSWKEFRSYLGMPGEPVRFVNSYSLSDTPFQPRQPERLDPAKGTFASTGAPQQNAEFGHYSDSIKDIVPSGHDLAPEDNPFATAYGRVTQQLQFNFGPYGQLLMRQFLEAGGKYEQRDFHTPADIALLKEKVVIHSTGFAAKALWGDKTMFPVRGQNARLTAQPEARYGVSYRGSSLLSKTDGVLVGVPLEGGDMAGVNNGNETPPARADVEAALKAIAPLFAKMEARA